VCELWKKFYGNMMKREVQYDLEETVAFIKKHRFSTVSPLSLELSSFDYSFAQSTFPWSTQVALQFPDELLKDSFYINGILQERLKEDGVRICILADTTYGRYTDEAILYF
jgi:diphthamide biosynthesis enzyme Dph1/Dph2-like protein